MPFTSGFFNSFEGDRKYDAEDVSSLFDGLITDGVYMHIGDHFTVNVVESGDNEDVGSDQISIGTGRAWFNHTWSLIDAPYYMNILEAEINYDRIDALVLEVNHNLEERKNELKWVSGTPATNPTKPTLTKSEDDNIYQYPLAYVTRKKNTPWVLQENIENAIGKKGCPFVTGIIQGISIDFIVAQWEDQWNRWIKKEQDKLIADFNEWFEYLQVTLDENAAAKLASDLFQLRKRVEHVETVAESNTKDIRMIVETLGKNGIYRGQCLGDSVTPEQMETIRSGEFLGMYLGDYWTIDGIDYYIVEFDKFLDEQNKHHVVILPDHHYINARSDVFDISDFNVDPNVGFGVTSLYIYYVINGYGTTAKGRGYILRSFINIDWAKIKEPSNAIKNSIYNIFGKDNILTHKETFDYYSYLPITKDVDITIPTIRYFLDKTGYSYSETEWNGDEGVFLNTSNFALGSTKTYNILLDTSMGFVEGNVYRKYIGDSDIFKILDINPKFIEETFKNMEITSATAQADALQKYFIFTRDNIIEAPTNNPTNTNSNTSYYTNMSTYRSKNGGILRGIKASNDDSFANNMDSLYSISSTLGYPYREVLTADDVWWPLAKTAPYTSSVSMDTIRDFSSTRIRIFPMSGYARNVSNTTGDFKFTSIVPENNDWSYILYDFIIKDEDGVVLSSNNVVSDNQLQTWLSSNLSNLAINQNTVMPYDYSMRNGKTLTIETLDQPINIMFCLG